MNSNTLKDKIKKVIGSDYNMAEKHGRDKKNIQSEQYDFLFNNTNGQDTHNSYLDVLDSYVIYFI